MEAVEERGFLFVLFSHYLGILFSDHIQDLMPAESDDEQEGRTSDFGLIPSECHHSREKVAADSQAFSINREKMGGQKVPSHGGRGHSQWEHGEMWSGGDS